jgi:hypothetical protein
MMRMVEPPESRLRKRWGNRLGRREHTLRSRRRASCERRALTLALLVAAGACAASSSGCRTPLASETDEEEQRAQATLQATLAAEPVPGAAVGLRVRLASGPAVDLDLYVTDPRFAETVYFANSRSRAGGLVVRDARCGSAAPRIDEIVFDAPPAGRYRIGVDYHSACTNDARRAAFAIEIWRGTERSVLRGSVEPGHFLSRVHEFSVGTTR